MGSDDDVSSRPIETVEELMKAKLSRFRCEQWCHLEWFKRIVVGTFVRVGIGQEANGKETFRCARVLSVLSSKKTYALGNTRTNLALNCQIGDSTRGFRLEFVSNQPFTDSEFTWWKNRMTKANMEIPSLKEITNISKLLDEHKNKKPEAKEFDKMIETKKKFLEKPSSFA